MKMMLPPLPTCAERIRGRAGPLRLLRVQPPEEAVVRSVRARCRRHLHIGGRDNLLVTPFAVSQPQQAESRHVVAVDPHAAAPPRAARDRRHPLAVDIHVGVGIRHPLPRRRRADGVHHLVAEHVGNRLLEDAQHRQRETVHAHVVVFVVTCLAPEWRAASSSPAPNASRPMKFAFLPHISPSHSDSC